MIAQLIDLFLQSTFSHQPESRKTSMERENKNENKDMSCG